MGKGLSDKALTWTGRILTILGIGVSLAAGVVETKQQNRTIDRKVDEKVAETIKALVSANQDNGNG